MLTPLARYLERHAEPEARALPRLDRRFDRVLTIPAFDEAPDFLDRVLQRLDSTDGLLIIVVVNAPDNADSNSLSTTRPFLTHLANAPGGVLPINRLDDPIPCKQGVGLARKIGADICCALIDKGDVTSPLIHMSDADVVLPPDYFDIDFQVQIGRAHV